jgi:hypothetical protein
MHIALLIGGILLVFNGCATYNAHEVGPTSIIQAQEEIPEEELLDVKGGGHAPRHKKGRASLHPLSPEKHTPADQPLGRRAGYAR